MGKTKSLISSNHATVWDLGREWEIKKIIMGEEWEISGHSFWKGKGKITLFCEGQFFWDLGNDWDY